MEEFFENNLELRQARVLVADVLDAHRCPEEFKTTDGESPATQVVMKLFLAGLIKTDD